MVPGHEVPDRDDIFPERDSPGSRPPKRYFPSSQTKIPLSTPKLATTLVAPACSNWYMTATSVPTAQLLGTEFRKPQLEFRWSRVPEPIAEGTAHRAEVQQWRVSGSSRH